MFIIPKKIMLSFGAFAVLATAGISAQARAQTTAIEAKQATTSESNGIDAAMQAFDKLTPEQQKQQIDQQKKLVETQMDQMIKQAATPEQKQQLEAAKTKALTQIDAMAKMTPAERKAFVMKAQETAQKQLQNVTPEQLKQLTPEQRAAFEKFKATQGVK